MFMHVIQTRFQKQASEVAYTIKTSCLLIVHASELSFVAQALQAVGWDNRPFQLIVMDRESTQV